MRETRRTSVRVSEMIVHAGGYCVDRILQAKYGHEHVVRTGQRSAGLAEVVLIVFEGRRRCVAKKLQPRGTLGSMPFISCQNGPLLLALSG